jgi:hypothetical protein
MFFFGFLGFLVPFVFLALIVLVIAMVAGGRGEPDPTGRRLYAIYLSTVTFIALFSVLGTGFFLLHSLLESILVDSASGCPPGIEHCFEPTMLGSGSGGNEVLEAALLVLASGVVLYLHGRKLLDLVDEKPSADSPSGRVILTFGYATAFGLVFTILGSSAAALSSLVDVLDPGGFASGDQATATVVSSGLFAGGGAWLFFYVWRTLGLGIATRTVAVPPTPPAAPPPGL